MKSLKKILSLCLGLVALVFFVTKSEIIAIILVSFAFIVFFLYLRDAV